ncbi:CBS domain-containing protein [Salinicola tamaricis]|uniref:CBS domain-containing protein n=1 Tax=Salinicola tamaricis TaxID=1771309 RepID=UPI0030F4B35F
MVPRHEVVGLDLDDDLDDLLAQIRQSQHTRLPIYKGDINDIVGILHLRNASRFLTKPDLTKAAIVQEAREPYFIPESTPLHTQLLNFSSRSGASAWSWTSMVTCRGWRRWRISSRRSSASSPPTWPEPTAISIRRPTAPT